jgi:trans-aconitate methyltransferase
MTFRAGPIYWSPRGYKAAMNVLQRWRTHELEQVANEIRPGARVVDLCCGDAALARHVTERGATYTGLDINPGFVKFGKTQGLDVRLWDARTDPVPDADVVCLTSSLYQFSPDERDLLDRMLEAARERVLLAEPVENVAAARSPLLRRLALWVTSVDGQVFESRHTEETLRALVADVGGESVRFSNLGRVLLVAIDTTR